MKHWRNYTARTQPSVWRRLYTRCTLHTKNPICTNKYVLMDTLKQVTREARKDWQSCPLACWNSSSTDLLSEQNSRHLCRILRCHTSLYPVQARVCAWWVRACSCVLAHTYYLLTQGRLILLALLSAKRNERKSSAFPINHAGEQFRICT
jgi:hypothetical protein